MFRFLSATRKQKVLGSERRPINPAGNEPLREGRHRGNSLGALRDATKEELETARKIAREMIEAYLAHLGRKALPNA
jgi:hypothetical protein